MGPVLLGLYNKENDVILIYSSLYRTQVYVPYMIKPPLPPIAGHLKMRVGHYVSSFGGIDAVKGNPT